MLLAGDAHQLGRQRHADHAVDVQHHLGGAVRRHVAQLVRQSLHGRQQLVEHVRQPGGDHAGGVAARGRAGLDGLLQVERHLLPQGLELREHLIERQRAAGRTAGREMIGIVESEGAAGGRGGGLRVARHAAAGAARRRGAHLGERADAGVHHAFLVDIGGHGRRAVLPAAAGVAGPAGIVISMADEGETLSHAIAGAFLVHAEGVRALRRAVHAHRPAAGLLRERAVGLGVVEHEVLLPGRQGLVVLQAEARLGRAVIGKHRRAHAGRAHVAIAVSAARTGVVAGNGLHPEGVVERRLLGGLLIQRVGRGGAVDGAGRLRAVGVQARRIQAEHVEADAAAQAAAGTAGRHHALLLVAERAGLSNYRKPRVFSVDSSEQPCADPRPPDRCASAFLHPTLPSNYGKHPIPKAESSEQRWTNTPGILSAACDVEKHLKISEGTFLRESLDHCFRP